MKKFISMVMAAAMVVSLVPATAFAADSATFKVVGDVENVNANYEIEVINEGELKITPRPIQVELENREWVYDGESHYDDTEYTNEHLTKGEGYYDLLDGHELITIESSKDYVINTWESVENNNNLLFEVYSGEDRLTENYKITVIATIPLFSSLNNSYTFSNKI